MGLFDEHGFEKNKKGKDDTYDEHYLIGVLDVEKYEIFYTLSPSRHDFAKLLLQLSTDKYAVVGVQMIKNVKDYEALLKDLKDDNKPEDMEFGK